MKNDDNYIEIEPQFLFKVVGAVLIAIYLIFLIGKYDDRKSERLLMDTYEEIEQIWSSNSLLKEALQQLDEPNIEDFKKIKDLSYDLFQDLNSRDLIVYQQLYIKRNGAFYLPESHGYACDEEVREIHLSETQLARINTLLKEKKNSFEDCFSDSKTQSDYHYGADKSFDYMLDFDPERTAFVHLTLID